MLLVMGELLGITGAIGSGKSTLAKALAAVEPNHAMYETWQVVAEVAQAFNTALKAELAFETTAKPIELTNQVLIWLPDAISEHLHHEVAWNQLAINHRDSLANPKLYKKLFIYLKTIGHNHKLLDQPITKDNKETYRPILQWIGGYLVAKISKTIWYDEIMRRIQLRNAHNSMILVAGLRYPSDAEVIRANGGRVIAIQRPGQTTANSDVTEDERDSIKPDITVINNGNAKDLQNLTTQLWNDIAAGSPGKTYSSLP